MKKTLVEIEEVESRKFDIEYREDGFPILSLENVAKVEAMLRVDSKYRKASDVNSMPIVKNGKEVYEGSAMYWINKFKNSNQLDEEIIRHIVRCVDRENSTHLNSDGVGIEEISDRIIKVGREKLIEYLRNPGEEFELIKIISKQTSPISDELDKRGFKKYNPRSNFSFATKFCHYMALELFKGDHEEDNFSIYDNVLDKAIKKYFPKYKKYTFNGNYLLYQKTVDEIIAGGKDSISRKGFDHLIWYCLKGE